MPPELYELEMRPGLNKFSFMGEWYVATRISFIFTKSKLIDNSNVGKYRLKRASFQTHRMGKPIKAKAQRPRWKELGIFDDLEGVREHILKGIK